MREPETTNYGNREEEVAALYGLFGQRPIGEALAIVAFFLASVARDMPEHEYESYSQSLILSMNNARDRIRVQTLLQGE